MLNSQSSKSISHVELTLIQYMDIEVATPTVGTPYAVFKKQFLHKFPKQYLRGAKHGQDLAATFKLIIP